MVRGAHFPSLPSPSVPPSRLQDATFDFEKRRNKPLKYDRDLMASTLAAMKKVGEISTVREKRYYNKRMEGVKTKTKALHKIEVAKAIDLIKPAVARKKEELNVATTAKVKEKAKQNMED